MSVKTKKRPKRYRRKINKSKKTAFDSTCRRNFAGESPIETTDLPPFLVEAGIALTQGENDRVAEIINEENVRSIEQMPDSLSKLYAVFVLATLFRKTKQLDKAELYCKKVLQFGEFGFAYDELANICQLREQRIQAVQYRRKALAADPNNHKLFWALGAELMGTGDVTEGSELLKIATIKIPDDNNMGDWFLQSLHYKPDITPKTLFEEHVKWADAHTPVTMAKTRHKNSPQPDRRLKIGYISPNFRRHSVAYFFEPLLDGCNKKTIEVFGYNNSKKSDEFTERLKSKFDCFRDIYNLDDEAVVQMIENDSIDILVDLAGHTEKNRLLVMAHKPAPIQVTYLGYPDTTGMQQIDYRLTDILTDPSQMQKFHTEKLVYLPNGFLCYRPPEFAPPLSPLPSAQKGYVTFGSFNVNTKINPALLSLWADVLKANDNSRLILKFIGGQNQLMKDYYTRQFEKLSIAPDRIDIYGFKSPVEHLQLYSEMDIALDTFPYNGTTTTCEALWMGVPVISLVGNSHASRVGCSILNRLDLDFFAVSSPQEYVAKATALAAKSDALAQIRASMRSRMSASPLCDSKKLACEVEAAYRKMWHKWCSHTPSEGLSRRPLNTTSHLAELAVMADKYHRTGRREMAVKYAIEGWESICRGENATDIPAEILLRWNVKDEKTLFLYLCIALISYSSYFNASMYKQLFLKWKELQPSNPEPYLRIGLLLALQAKQAGIAVPSESLEALNYAAKIMQDERSAAALALASNSFSELEIPYDEGRIHLYPDLLNMTTYVLLEQADWFEHDDLALFRNLVQPGDRVLDLGANVGVYAISAALRTGSRGRVIAVEPAKETFELLNKSSSVFTHMTAVKGAVSNKSGTALLSQGNSPELNKLEAGQQKAEKVNLFSVDDLANDTGMDCFDIIKMDVEGQEQQAIEGAKKIIHENSPVIFYEIKQGPDFHFKLIDAFAKIGYDSYYYVRGTSTLVKFCQGMEIDGYLLNMIAARPQSLSRFDGLVNIT